MTFVKDTPRYHALTRELRRVLSPNQVVLVGSAALAHRYMRDVNDLDVLVEEKAFQWMTKHFPHDWSVEHDTERDIYAASTPAGMIQLSSHAAAFVGSAGLCAQDIVKNALHTVDGLLIMSLTHVYQVKLARRQEKDLDDLRLIGELLDRTESDR